MCRSILQRWKRALHVPLRLDVYYQHPDGQRELLERWCLEYAPRMTAPGDGGSSVIPSAFATSDPIVQLRQVCKNIVIWLRTLYCWSRMLPAQTLRKVTTLSSLQNPNSPPPIGFSIYVVSEGQDDVSGLMANQGFHSQGQPHSVLTPYGELGWKVFHAPKSVVQRLLPASPSGTPYHHSNQYWRQQQQQPGPLHGASTAAMVTMDKAQQYNSRAMVSSRGTTTAKTQPIPIRQDQQPPLQQQYAQQQQQQHPQYGTAAAAGAQYVPTKGGGGGQQVARSAPQQQSRLYRRTHSDYQTDTAQAHAAQSYHQRQQLLLRMGKAKSGDINKRILGSHDDDDDDTGWGSGGGGGNNGQPFPFHRPSESISQRLRQPHWNGVGSNGRSDDRPPTKNLSALSLALMMSDDQSSSLLNHSLGTADDTTDGSGGEEGGTNGEATTGATSSAEEAAAAEKRRAALHNAPPQLFTANSPSAVASSPLMHRTSLTGIGAGATGAGLHSHPRVAAAAGEYGYAYNNHIPTMEQYHGSSPHTPNTPNTNNTSSAAYQQYHGLHPTGTSSVARMPMTMEAATSAPPGTYSPSFRPSTPLGTTPPGYLLGVTPGTQVIPNSLIPPRSGVTPPFVRPMGFVGEAPNQPVPPSPSAAYEAGATTRNDELDSGLHHHQTSLDLLHSSPFQYPPSYSFYSIHNNPSSHSATSGSLLNQTFDPNTAAAAAFLSDCYHRSALLSSDDPRLSVGQESYEDYADDMPFAVDLGVGFASTTSQSAAGGAASSSSSGHPATGLAMMTEASLVASMCTTAPRRLAMFDSKMGASGVPGGSTNDNDCVSNNDLTAVMDSLADQLAEFKSFGASLTESSSAAYAATATASSSS